MTPKTLFLAAALAFATPALAQQDSGDAIRETIQSQLNAFLEDDFATAFTFAAPTIKQMFRTPENFGAMVRNGYPMVWRPKDVQFGAQRPEGADRVQTVVVQDAQGRSFVLEYLMRLTDGAWRIAGVQVLRTPQANV